MASKLKLGLGSGLLNFDLIGTFFDFSVASTGKWGDGRSDTWYSAEIQNFWVKGTVALKSEFNLNYIISRVRYSSIIGSRIVIEIDVQIQNPK